MKIREIRATGLRGATPEGGWSEELELADSVHTIITVVTDEGIVGYGSVFTTPDLVRAAFSGTDLVEYLIGSPYIDELAAHPFELDADGLLPIPEEPGLGIELNSDALAKYGDERE